jgi:uncharacterized protein YjbI with pentapeptide repeats
MTGVSFKNCSFQSITLKDVNLEGAKILGSSFDGADLTGANLTGATIKFSTFIEATMEGAILDSVVVKEVKFTDAILTLASLKNAKLKNVTFRGATLYETSFKDADLQGVSFYDAELDATDFSGTALEGTSEEYIVSFGSAEQRRTWGAASGPLFKLKKALRYGGDPVDPKNFKKVFPNEFRKLIDKAGGGNLSQKLADRIERESITPFEWYVTRQTYDYPDQRLSSEPNEVLVLNANVAEVLNPYARNDDWEHQRKVEEITEFFDILEHDRDPKHPKEAFPLLPIGWVRFSRDVANRVILIEEIQSDFSFVRLYDPKENPEYREYRYLSKYAERFYEDAIALVFDEAREGGYTVEMLGYEDKREHKAPKSVYVDLPTRMGMRRKDTQSGIPLKDRVSYYDPNPSRPKRWRGR